MERDPNRQAIVEARTLDAVVAGMPAGVIVAEAPSGRIVLTNELAEALLRRSPVEASASRLVR